MCGIAGYYYTSEKKIGTTHHLIEALESQRHRGPDDTGIRAFSLTSMASKEYPASTPETVQDVFEGILGFNRLSILDLSQNGHQPMCSPDGQVILAFNGEIYNAFEYKDELQAAGYQFRSNTDTEVILYLYLLYGFEGMIKRLNGMFAIVLADLRKQQLFLARDRFGIKPLYLFETTGMFAFASEIKSFLPLPEFKAILNTELLDEYLLFRNAIHRTLFKNVSCLTPGTYQIYTPSSGFTSHTFFDIEEYQRTALQPTLAVSLKETGQLVKESVNRQLLSDVKLGCQLSGGVDSSLVTYFAQAIKQDNLLETVSVIFDDAAFSEEFYIDQVAKKLGLLSHKFKLEPTYYLNSFEKATWHFESPLNHPNTIGIYLLSQQAKKYVTVLLSGEGADEVFGGYDRFSHLVNPYYWKTFISGLKRSRNHPFQFINRYFSAANRAVLAAAFMTPEQAKLLKRDFQLDRALYERKKLYESTSGSTFDRQVKYEIKSYLPDLLLRQDKMSMAHSIENRVPFLDNELVAHAFSIPEKYLMPDGNSIKNLKYSLKKLAETAFGESFAFRDKQGFGIPLRAFFHSKPFQSYIKDEILPAIIDRGLFNGSEVEKWCNNVNTISVADIESLWIMISFEAWAKKFKV